MQTIVPAPWVLSGNGTVLLYHFPKEFNRNRGFLNKFQQTGYRGWLGAVMIMHYTHSPVGPYQELLFIPGLIRQSGQLSFSVSKLYVSSDMSRQSGWRNWGLPKELAEFELQQQTGGGYTFRVEKEGDTIFQADIGKSRFSLPFNTRLFPFTHLVQASATQFLFTRPKARGHIGLASLQSVSANADFFPPIQQQKPLLVLSLHDYMLKFPVALALSPAS